MALSASVAVAMSYSNACAAQLAASKLTPSIFKWQGKLQPVHNVPNGLTLGVVIALCGPI